MNKLHPEEVERLLIRGTNWVGDAVMSIPAMREIRRIFPRADISLLVKPWVRDVYSAVDFIDALVDYDCEGIHQGWTGVWRLASQIRQGSYDAAILLQNAFEAAFITWMAGVPIRVGYARDARGILLTHPCEIDPGLEQMHQAFYYLGILTAAGLLDPQCCKKPGYPLSIKIGVCEADRASARGILRGQGIEPGETIVGLNPGAYYGGAKRWLSERYALVADALAVRRGVRIAIFGSANERRIAEDVAAQMANPPIVLAGRTTLGQLMGLISECSLLITNDSGPMHLAAALDVPQLAIFGSTSEVATGPLSERAEVIKEQVECNPCFLRECPIDFRCMTGITVERVLSAAEKRLTGT